MKTRGIVIGLLLLSVLLLLAGCNGGGGEGLCVGCVAAKDQAGSISVLVGIKEGSPSGPGVEDAVVTINDAQIPADLGRPGLYMDLGNVVIDDLDDVLLEVQRRSSSISATLAMPEKPLITSPTEGEHVDGAVDVLWSSATDPDTFEVLVLRHYTASGADYDLELPGTARGLSMVGVFDTSWESAAFTVLALNTTTSFTGDASPDSTFAVGNSADRRFDPD